MDAERDPDSGDGNYITYEFKIEFEEVWGTGTPSGGKIVGFAIRVYDNDAGSSYYWGSGSVGITDPSTWGDLQIPEFSGMLLPLIASMSVGILYRRKKSVGIGKFLPFFIVQGYNFLYDKKKPGA